MKVPVLFLFLFNYYLFPLDLSLMFHSTRTVLTLLKSTHTGLDAIGTYLQSLPIKVRGQKKFQVT